MGSQVVSAEPAIGGQTVDRGPEAEIVSDMLRRTAPSLPILIVAIGAFWGWDGIWSAALGVVIVLINYALTAVIMSVTGRKSPSALMAGVLVGYAIRMGLVVLALYYAKHSSWAEIVPLGITLVITHVGLLLWEQRHISATLAFPGLKPTSLPRPENKEARPS
jgi:hypothetical protein